MLEREVVDDPSVRNDLVHPLQGLVDAADIDAFIPISLEELSDQQTPAFILQLGSIVQAAVDLAITERVLVVGRLKEQASWQRIGRYAMISGKNGANVGIWLGVHFRLWKAHGATPLWDLLFRYRLGPGTAS